MYGAIIGDLAGSIYEYGQVNNIHTININKIIDDECFYSDDTIMTVAIIDAILNDKDYEKYIRMYANNYLNYKPDFKPYFKTAFSPGFIKWLNRDKLGNSIGNGAMMRISPIGYMFNMEEDVILNSMLVTKTSHNSADAIKYAEMIALIIYYFRMGLGIWDVYNKLKIIPIYKPFSKFNTTCSETIGNCLYALYNSNSFSDAIRKTIMMGGDTDTNAAIVGGMAEALYGIDDDLVLIVKDKIPKEFVDTIDNGYRKIKKIKI